MVPHVWNADLISELVHFCVPATHLSYTSGPDWLSTISLSQSLPGQPSSAPPLFSATHHGVVPPLLIWLCSAMRSAHVLAGLNPLASKFLGSYHTRPLRSAHE